MFTGWGIRTLSAKEVALYNPLGYHIGTVWPHDNSIIACGLYRYGFYDNFSSLFTAMCEAAGAYMQFRLPELFAGLDRGGHNVPIKYPVACSPQAWSAGTVPFMLMGSLGLKARCPGPQADSGKPIPSRVVEPGEHQSRRIGDSLIGLEFQRKARGTLVDIEKKRGDIRVTVEY